MPVEVLSLAQLATSVAVVLGLAKILGYLFKLAVVFRDTVKASVTLAGEVKLIDARVTHIEGALGIVTIADRREA